MLVPVGAILSHVFSMGFHQLRIISALRVSSYN